MGHTKSTCLPFAHERAEVLNTYQALFAECSPRTLPGTGNVGRFVISPDGSVDAIIVTPSGLDPHYLSADDMVIVYPDDRPALGKYEPTSEKDLYRFAAQILVQELGRHDVCAIIHTHAYFATSVALLLDESQKAVPPAHYAQVLAVGGDGQLPFSERMESAGDIFASSLSNKRVARAIGNKNAALWNDHGLVVVAPSLSTALKRHDLIEESCRRHWETAVTDRRLRTLTARDADAIHMRATTSYGQRRSGVETR